MKVASRLLALFVVVALFISMTACGIKDNRAGTESAKEGQTETKDTKDEQPKTGSTEEEKKPVIKFLHSFTSLDLYNEPAYKDIVERTGYEVEYSMLPQDASARIDKLNLIMSSGEPYDIVKISDKIQFYDFAVKGALKELDDLVEGYCPNIKIGYTDKTLNTATIDGVLYGIPSPNASQDISESFAIRKDWLDTLNLSIPVTIDDYYEVLKSFKDNATKIKSDGNIVPLTGHNWHLSFARNGFLGAFGLCREWVEKDGKLVNTNISQDMKDYLQFAAKLYEEGLIDVDLPINKSANAEEKWFNGTAGMKTVGWGDGLKKVRDNNPNAEPVFIEPPVGLDGRQEANIRSAVTIFTAIPKASENPEHAMKFINEFLSEENFKFLTIGEEGVHHKVVDGNYLPVDMDVFNQARGAAWYFPPILDELRYPKYWQARIKKDKDFIETFDWLQRGVDKYGVEDPLNFSPPMPVIAKYASTLNALVEEYFIKIIAGVEPIDKFDEFVNRWRSSGGDEATEEINNWYVNRNK